MIHEGVRMKIILFDLGDTLEQNDILLPGALDMLQAVQQLQDPNGRPPVLGLVSDFFPLPEEIVRRQQKYYDLLQRLHIRSFFEPVEKHVTLSTEMVSFIVSVHLCDQAKRQGAYLVRVGQAWEARKVPLPRAARPHMRPSDSRGRYGVAV